MKLLLLFLFLELSLFASVGKISALNGKITIDRQSKQLDADIGTMLEEKDIVSSDDKSKAQIIMNDGTVLSIGKSSKLNISEYVFDEKNPQESKADFKFVEGTFKSITGAIGKVAPEKFKLETKSASIGIRGTIVVGNQEKVACTQGQITVTSAGVTQVLPAGTMTTTEQGKAPTAPTKIEVNLLKDVDNVGSKEETKTNTTENSNNNKTTENSEKTEDNQTKTESQSQQKSTTTSTTAPVVNLSTLTEVTNTANNTTTQTSTNQIQENTTSLATEAAKKKAQEEAAALLAAEEAKKKVQDETSILKETTLATVSDYFTQASKLNETVQSSLEETQTASQTATNTVSNASANALTDATNAASTASSALKTAKKLAQDAQNLYSQINSLYIQAQNATLDEASRISSQIKSLTSSYNSIVTDIGVAKNTAIESSKAVINIPFYSTNIILNSDISVGSKTFSVGNGGSTVTIATYTTASGMDPVLILLKKNSDGEYVSIDTRNDDSWTKSPNFYNSIINVALTAGDYMITVADFPFNSNESENLDNKGSKSEGDITLYITSSSSLTFSSSEIENIEKYSYISKLNNQAFINDLSYSTAKIEENNAKFGILADSKIGTAIKIDDYGYFVTISDSFVGYNNGYNESDQNVFLESKGNSEIEDGSSWGYWTKTLSSSSSTATSIDMKSVWVSGNKVTPPTEYNATFSGQVIGSVNHDGTSGHIVLDSSNVFNATIDIGAGKISKSLIKFTDSVGGIWSGSFNTNPEIKDPSVNQQGFSSNINGTMLLGESQTKAMTGALSGKYFGTTNSDGISTVKSIGGSFNMSATGTSTANGVFKARDVALSGGGVE